MILVSDTLVKKEKQPWQTQLQNMAKSVVEVLDRLGLSIENLPYELDVNPDFKVRVTDFYLSLMDANNPYDPLLLQVLPLAAEREQADGFSAHPLQEAKFEVAPGLICKYHNRALVVSNGSCAINCRYCFRRNFPYQEHAQKSNDWQLASQWLAENKQVDELIFSGGDPLMNSDRWFESVVPRLVNSGNIKRIRIHTRVPVVLPQRISEQWLQCFDGVEQQKIIMLHINHVHEITSELIIAVQQLQRAGFKVFNQTVLLHGINDDVDALVELMSKSFDVGIQPYYLFLLDRVLGSQHFEVSELKAVQLYKNLRARLSGYMVPQLAREIPGEPYKTVFGLQGE